MKVSVAIGLMFSAMTIAATAQASEFCGRRERNARGASTIPLDPGLHAMRKQFGFYVTVPEEGLIYID